MKTKRMLWPWLLAALALLAAVGILGSWLAREFLFRPDPDERRALAVETAQGWLGARESDGSHHPIVDVYNSHYPLARGYEVTYSDDWCAVFVSAVAVQCGYTDIIPTECSCEEQINLFRGMGCWQENDDYIPRSGDIIYYSRTHGNDGDNIGWAEHVGIVVAVWGDTIQVIEGNREDDVSYRYIEAGDWVIRGYGLPEY